jgi:multidrug efflux pump subunit AcrA (membrane-fusion protein)
MVVLRESSGREERFSSTTVVRPGIFLIDIRPGESGERELGFEITVDGVSETIAGGKVRVGTPEEPGGLISPPLDQPSTGRGEAVGFLLEQQWSTGFASEWVKTGTLHTSVAGTARIEPPSGGEVVLTAPVNGVIRAVKWPYTGQRVASGGTLLSLIPTTNTQRSLAELQASVREIEALNEAAVARVQRLEDLLERKAVSRREVEHARAEATGLGARLEAAVWRQHARSSKRRKPAGRAGRVSRVSRSTRPSSVGSPRSWCRPVSTCLPARRC